jgi:hypothetical protein
LVGLSQGSPQEGQSGRGRLRVGSTGASFYTAVNQR